MLSRWLEIAVTAGSVKSSAGHIDGLDRRDRNAADRGDALMQSRDLAGERRLVADPRRQPPEQARHFAARLDEAKDIVHQQQHVLALLVAEIFRDRQRGERRRASARRAARSSGHRRARCGRARRSARISMQKLVALARALANAGEHRNALIALDHRVDQLHHQRRSCRRRRRRTSPPCRPAASGASRSMTLMPVSKMAVAGLRSPSGGGGAVDRRTRQVGGQRRAVVANAAGNVEKTAEHGLADRHRDRTTGGNRTGTPRFRPAVA